MMIFGSPTCYIQGPGVIARLPGELGQLGASAALIVDPGVEQMITTRLKEAPDTLQVHIFGGEISDAEIDRLASAIGRPDVIAAAGGGKCLDAGKALAHRLGVPVVTVPTAASTDAPTSHNYVVYDDNHRLLEVRKLPANPRLVVVDTEVIAAAPRHLLAAGIGDAIGKIYEVECCYNAGGTNIYGGQSLLTPLILARACHDILREHAASALAAADRKTPDAAFEKVVEAATLMSGLAFESGGLSVAHSMTRGLSAVARYASALHGMQVAYATIVQVVLERRSRSEIDALARFHTDCGLPRTLAELGGAPARGDIEAIAKPSAAAPHIANFPRQIGADDIAAAMQWVESRYS